MVAAAVRRLLVGIGEPIRRQHLLALGEVVQDAVDVALVVHRHVADGVARADVAGPDPRRGVGLQLADEPAVVRVVGWNAPGVVGNPGAIRPATNTEPSLSTLTL